ncbi:MAG: AMP-binding protein [Desulfobacteraceae bacterium]|nr:AMP-binding protein [Desulfobacteraceae bacterium]
MGIYDLTCYDIIRRNAWMYKDVPAWLEEHKNRSTTFAEFMKNVDELACGLQQSGIAKGDRIGVIGKNSLEYFMIYGAAAAIGAIVLPINWRLSADEMIFNLNDGEPKMLFVDKEFQEIISDALDRIPSVEICHNLSDGGGFGDFDALFDNGSEFRSIEVFSDDGYIIIHTAAVAGRPRGALLTHSNVLCANMHLRDGLNLSSSDVHLNLLPLFHVGGLFMAFSAFHAGVQNINMPKFDGNRAVELIAEKNVSLLFDFSPILGNVLDEHEKSGRDISSLQKVIGLDSPETIERYQKLTGGTFFSMYGQTETSCLVSLSPYNHQPGSAGRPIPLCDIMLSDDDGCAVPVGKAGEILVRGPMVFKGYWGLEEETARTFRDGWHHTGDLGRIDGGGYLWYAGRKAEKELIKPGGENVYPAEVEKAILAHPAVEKTVVFGVPDPKWKEGIKAVCLLQKGQSLTSKDLIRFVGRRIASFKKPQYVEFVDALPMTPSGEIDRDKVKALYS